MGTPESDPSAAHGCLFCIGYMGFFTLFIILVVYVVEQFLGVVEVLAP